MERQNREPFSLSQFADSFMPADWVSLSERDMLHAITEIIVSNIDEVQPVDTAEYWLRMGHYIFDASNGMPLVIGPDGNCCLAPTTISHPRFDEWFNIGEHKNSFQRQIKNLDWRLHQIGVAVKGWPCTGHQYRLKPGDRLDIERKPVYELTRVEFKALEYIERGKYINGLHSHVWLLTTGFKLMQHAVTHQVTPWLIGATSSDLQVDRASPPTTLMGYQALVRLCLHPLVLSSGTCQLDQSIAQPVLRYSVDSAT
jgi:hypothetical protein